MDIEKLITQLRENLHISHVQQSKDLFNAISESIDKFIEDKSKSPLERAFFLILHQFPTDSKDYIVYANEQVLIPNIYDELIPAIEYEIDFALYGGNIDNPVKVAIECDGIRSHRHEKTKKDRRKEVNLQADGWIVMRFNSKEIHEELQKFESDANYVCDFLRSIEKVIKEQLRIITYENYIDVEFRSKLTGYKWGRVTCKECGFTQYDTLNHKKILCRKCKKKYVRDIKPDEKILTEKNGILFFKK